MSNNTTSLGAFISDVGTVEAVIEGLILSLICVLAVTANFSLWLVILRTRDLRNESNMLILCLSLADLLVSSVSMPITVYTISVSRWHFTSTTCTAIGYINMLTFTASVQSLGAISINRYIKICRPSSFISIYTYRNVLFMCVGVWLVSGMLSLPPLLGWSIYSYLPYASLCFCDWSTSLSYAIFMISVCFCVPCLIMVFCYVSILRTFFQSRKTIQSFAKKHNSSSGERPSEIGDGMTGNGLKNRKCGCCKSCYSGLKNCGLFFGVRKSSTLSDLGEETSSVTRMCFDTHSSISGYTESGMKSTVTKCLGVVSDITRSTAILDQTTEQQIQNCDQNTNCSNLVTRSTHLSHNKSQSEMSSPTTIASHTEYTFRHETNITNASCGYSTNPPVKQLDKITSKENGRHTQSEPLPNSEPSLKNGLHGDGELMAHNEPLYKENSASLNKVSGTFDNGELYQTPSPCYKTLIDGYDSQNIGNNLGSNQEVDEACLMSAGRFDYELSNADLARLQDFDDSSSIPRGEGSDVDPSCRKLQAVITTFEQSVDSRQEQYVKDLALTTNKDNCKNNVALTGAEVASFSGNSSVGTKPVKRTNYLEEKNLSAGNYMPNSNNHDEQMPTQSGSQSPQHKSSKAVQQFKMNGGNFITSLQETKDSDIQEKSSVSNYSGDGTTTEVANGPENKNTEENCARDCDYSNAICLNSPDNSLLPGHGHFQNGCVAVTRTSDEQPDQVVNYPITDVDLSKESVLSVNDGKSPLNAKSEQEWSQGSRNNKLTALVSYENQDTGSSKDTHSGNIKSTYGNKNRNIFQAVPKLRKRAAKSMNIFQISKSNLTTIYENAEKSPRQRHNKENIDQPSLSLSKNNAIENVNLVDDPALVTLGPYCSCGHGTQCESRPLHSVENKESQSKLNRWPIVSSLNDNPCNKGTQDSLCSSKGKQGEALATAVDSTEKRSLLLWVPVMIKRRFRKRFQALREVHPELPSVNAVYVGNRHRKVSQSSVGLTVSPSSSSTATTTTVYSASFPSPSRSSETKTSVEDEIKCLQCRAIENCSQSEISTCKDIPHTKEAPNCFGDSPQRCQLCKSFHLSTHSNKTQGSQQDNTLRDNSTSDQDELQIISFDSTRDEDSQSKRSRSKVRLIKVAPREGTPQTSPHTQTLQNASHSVSMHNNLPKTVKHSHIDHNPTHGIQNFDNNINNSTTTTSTQINAFIVNTSESTTSQPPVTDPVLTASSIAKTPATSHHISSKSPTLLFSYSRSNSGQNNQVLNVSSQKNTGSEVLLSPKDLLFPSKSASPPSMLRDREYSTQFLTVPSEKGKHKENLLSPPKVNGRDSSTTMSKMDKRKREEFQLSASLLVVIVIFIICWFPYCISMFMSIFSPEKVTRGFDMASLLLGYLNSCVNPIVYGLMNKKFKLGYKKWFATCFRPCRQGARASFSTRVRGKISIRRVRPVTTIAASTSGS